ncbi:MAG: metal-dependent hydrolase [Chloroflexi bacterium]|nr:metal-dependent hydrolase [Chloroflexota bacterium]
MFGVLLFGHIGITLGAVWATNRFLQARERRRAKAPVDAQNVTSSRTSFSQKVLSFTGKLDYRLVLFAAMLPDVIDKPIGQFFFREVFSYGRIFAHTLLFLILITLGGLYLYRSRCQTWLLTLSIGTFAHLVLDQLWRVPRTLFWPLLGFTFDRISLSEWMPNIFRALLTDPQSYVPELVGLAILTYLAVRLRQRKAVLTFFRSGKLD